MMRLLKTIKGKRDSTDRIEADDGEVFMITPTLCGFV